MNLAKTAIERPIWVAVSVVLIFLLGLLSIRGLPVQLFPDIDRPHLNITVDWRSASPQEMESEITAPIEQEMQGVQGLKSLSSNSYPGFTEIDMEFALGTDMQRAQLDVISRLNRVSGLPDNILALPGSARYDDRSPPAPRLHSGLAPFFPPRHGACGKTPPVPPAAAARKSARRE